MTKSDIRAQPESNRRPQDLQSHALPLSYAPLEAAAERGASERKAHGSDREKQNRKQKKACVLQEGLEPPTLGLLDPCSTKLSYQSKRATTRDRSGDLQIFSLTLSQLSYSGEGHVDNPSELSNASLRARKKCKRGLGGIEPPTSPTLKENHTTRPKAHIGARRAGRADCAEIEVNLARRSPISELESLGWPSGPRRWSQVPIS